ncbi:MAG: C40 family peptidase [Duodenibacillus sp.]|nr:C40 family peptidase [Duodenibacillus sp.]
MLTASRRRLFAAAAGLAAALLAGCSSAKPARPEAKRTTPSACKKCIPGKAGLKARTVVFAALGQCGIPYVYGGITPGKGFDCSGLIVWAFRRIGIDLPRTAAEQARCGRSVWLRNAAPGDIIVFKTGWSQRHTGIVAGAGRFVHAPRPGRTVCCESYNTDYWLARLIAVRRVI